MTVKYADDSAAGEFARPWKGTRIVGPHIVRPVRSPVHVHDAVHGVHGLYTYQWECKYCDESAVHLAAFTHVSRPCNEFEWFDSELAAIRGD